MILQIFFFMENSLEGMPTCGCGIYSAKLSYHVGGYLVLQMILIILTIVNDGIQVKQKEWFKKLRLITIMLMGN